ncbi:9679_t:CDS:1 [Funneliformis geosporum]|uniref:10441_t:CDS:1 n=1 Tax=Funneliformis geosporum TaxID=1117311 RepID=A0A9W4SR32_9GLOM|nr:10441_t:CDS:1 [Funneliformis geosporum]CAI2181575.1 9679_t:CDS:1 [Funneliformis geosporum]
MEIEGFNSKVIKVQQIFEMYRSKVFPSPLSPIEAYNSLIYENRPTPRRTTTTMLGLLNLIVSQEAEQIQITNKQVVSRVSYILYKEASQNELQEYKKLSIAVNNIILHKNGF